MIKVLHSICQQIWKTQQQPQDWKRSVFIPIPMKGNAKECSNYCTTALISHASKVILKILQVGLNNTWTENFQIFNLVLERAEEPEIKLPTSVGSGKKQENYRKTLASLTMLKLLTVWITKFCKPGFSNTWTVNFQMFKFRKDRGTRDQLPTSAGSSKSKRVPKKHLFLLYWLCQSLWLCGSQ